MLRITETIFITADDSNFMVKELSTIKKSDSSNFGSCKETPLGYYSTLDGAVTGVLQILLRRKLAKKEVVVLKDVIADLNKIYLDIRQHMDPKKEEANGN